jgi:hypothetical protein
VCSSIPSEPFSRRTSLGTSSPPLAIEAPHILRGRPQILVGRRLGRTYRQGIGSAQGRGTYSMRARARCRSLGLGLSHEMASLYTVRTGNAPQLEPDPRNQMSILIHVAGRRPSQPPAATVAPLGRRWAPTLTLTLGSRCHCHCQVFAQGSRLNPATRHRRWERAGGGQGQFRPPPVRRPLVHAISQGHLRGDVTSPRPGAQVWRPHCFPTGTRRLGARGKNTLGVHVQ